MHIRRDVYCFHIAVVKTSHAAIACGHHVPGLLKYVAFCVCVKNTV